MLKAIYNVIVVGNQKAIVGFILAVITVLISKVGLDLDMTIRQVVEALASGLIVSLGVWVKANKD